MEDLGWNDRSRSHRSSLYSTRTGCYCRLLYNTNTRKKVKPLLCRKSSNETAVKRKLFSSNRNMTFVQDGAPPNTAKATQTWCETNLPNFIEKSEWPANSPDLNPIESLWSIIDEFTYEDPIRKTMKGLKRLLKLAWTSVPFSRLRDSHSMPKRLQNVIKNNGGNAGY